MAICKLNKNLTRVNSCGYSLPEIVNIWLVNFDEITDTDFSSEDGCEEITSMTLASSATVSHVEPLKNSASFEDTLVVADNGTRYRNASISFSVAGTYDSCMHGALDALSLGRYFAMVQTADGNYLGFGRMSPLEAETATLAGGSDNNGLQVVLSGNIAESPMPMSEAAVNKVKEKVVQD